MAAYKDYQQVLVLEPKFTPAAEQIKNFILTKKVDAPTMANAPCARLTKFIIPSVTERPTDKTKSNIP